MPVRSAKGRTRRGELGQRICRLRITRGKVPWYNPLNLTAAGIIPRTEGQGTLADCSPRNPMEA
jgi:hypothetical protein